jgi:hypothetical protein
MHESVNIDVRNGLRASAACPARFVEARTFERYDGPFASWAHAAGRVVVPTAYSPLCGDASPETAHDALALAIRYPHDGARFVIDPDRPRGAQSIPLKVDAPASTTVAVFVDGRLAGHSRSGAPVHWSLERGAHAIVAEADGQRSEAVNVSVQ